MTAIHDPSVFADVQEALREANLAFAASHQGEGPGRQPVHTVYGGAQLFASDSVPKLGAIALRAMNQYMPDAATMGSALGISEHPALAVIDKRVRDKLTREPIEDFRIDFEDGYGNRPDAEEDHHAGVVASEVSKGMSGDTLSPFIGLRVKPLNEEMRVRSIRTLDLVLTKLVENGGIPERWVVTIPKVTIIEQVEYTVAVLRQLEHKLGLADGTLKFELMVETPQIIIDSKGTSLLARARDASDGRLRGAHFGTYDYTAGINITAAHQRMRHPACDFREAFHAGCVCGHRSVAVGWIDNGDACADPPRCRGRPAAYRAAAGRECRECARCVEAALRRHPAFACRRILSGMGSASGAARHTIRRTVQLLPRRDRRRRSAAQHFVGKAAQATLVGDVFDDAATGQGLLNFFLRGINSGAITEDEALRMTGLTPDEFRGRSFVRIMKGRK